MKTQQVKGLAKYTKMKSRFRLGETQGLVDRMVLAYDGRNRVEIEKVKSI